MQRENTLKACRLVPCNSNLWLKACLELLKVNRPFQNPSPFLYKLLWGDLLLGSLFWGFLMLENLFWLRCFSLLLYILQILVFSPGYPSKCILSTCLLRFLVSFVENACQQKIFKMSIKWYSDIYVLKIPGGWVTQFGQHYLRWLTSLNRVLSFEVFLCWKTCFGLDVVWEWL